MSCFNEENTLRLGNKIMCEATLEEAITTMLECNPSKQKKALEHFRERAIQVGLAHYVYHFDFQNLVDHCKRKITYTEAERLFRRYHGTEDPILKLFLKKRLLKEFPQLIKNRKDFEVVEEHFKQKWMSPEPENKLTSLSDFDQTESVKFLIPEILPQQGLVLLTGLPKLGKSSLACEMAYSVVTGDPLFNRPTTQGKVLVISLDENRRETEAKYKARGFNSRENAEENIKFIWEINSLTSLENFLKQYGPDLVIFDSLQQLSSRFNISENSQKMGNFLSNLKALLEKYNSVGLIIHHANKAKSSSTTTKIRGSSAIAAATSVNLFLEAKNNQIILTATGRDIVALEYQLTLNSRTNWETTGVYSLLDDRENNSTVEQMPEESLEESPEESPEESGVEIAAPTEETKQQSLESDENKPASQQKSTKKKRITIRQKLKEIIYKKGKITNDEIIKEAVKVAISQHQVQNHLKLLQKSGQITTLAELNLENNHGAFLEIYYTIAS